MAVNDIFTLPHRMRAMVHMADLLDTEQIEIDNLYNEVKENENQLFINSATKEINRYEKMFALPSNDDYTLDERRAKIIAKLNTRSPATVNALEEISSVITKAECKITEQYSEYLFTIEIDRKNVSRFDMLVLMSNINELKQAHLEYKVVFDCKVLFGCSIKTTAYKINYDLQDSEYSGEVPCISTLGVSSDKYLQADVSMKGYLFTSPISGIYPDLSMVGFVKEKKVSPNAQTSININKYDLCDETSVSGTEPISNIEAKIDKGEINPKISATNYISVNEFCGTDYCGEGG